MARRPRRPAWVALNVLAPQDRASSATAASDAHPSAKASQNLARGPALPHKSQVPASFAHRGQAGAARGRPAASPSRERSGTDGNGMAARPESADHWPAAPPRQPVKPGREQGATRKHDRKVNQQRTNGPHRVGMGSLYFFEQPALNRNRYRNPNRL